MCPLSRRPILLVFLSCLGLQTGCATYLPQLRLESPEATGSEKLGRAELAGTQGGVNLSAEVAMRDQPAQKDADGNPLPADPPVPYLQPTWAAFFVGFVKGFGDSWDLGIRLLQPTAPFQVRVKYQFLGQPESRAEFGNFSLAALVSPGLTAGPGNGTETLFYLAGDVTLLAGIRLGRSHLIWLSPSFTFASIRGLASTAGAAGGTVLTYGGGVGYQLTVLGFFGRAEFNWAWGSAGENRIDGPSLGALVGLRL